MQILKSLLPISSTWVSISTVKLRQLHCWDSATSLLMLLSVTILVMSSAQLQIALETHSSTVILPVITQQKPVTISFSNICPGFEQNSGKDQNQVNIKCH